MDKEMKDKVVGDMLNATRNFLSYALHKSGVRGDTQRMRTMVSFRMNDNKLRSMFLGEYTTPSETCPNGEIIIHVDAVFDYAAYLGVDYWSMIAKVLFSQVHHALTWDSKKTFDFEKSEKFATKICKKLMKQTIITDPRPKIYIAGTDRLNLLARQKWIEKWTGMGMEEAFTKLNSDELPSKSDVTE